MLLHEYAWYHCGLYHESTQRFTCTLSYHLLWLVMANATDDLSVCRFVGTTGS
jgi:hypothetical protein